MVIPGGPRIILMTRRPSLMDQPARACTRCSRTIGPGDTIRFGPSRLSSIECGRPQVLSAEERALLFLHCCDHALCCDHAVECAPCAPAGTPWYRSPRNAVPEVESLAKRMKGLALRGEDLFTVLLALSHSTSFPHGTRVAYSSEDYGHNSRRLNRSLSLNYRKRSEVMTMVDGVEVFGLPGIQRKPT